VLLALPSERRGHARAPDTVTIVINGEYNMMRTIFFSTVCTLMWGGKLCHPVLFQNKNARRARPCIQGQASRVPGTRDIEMPL